MERDQRYPTDAFGLPEGLLAAIGCAVLLVGSFVLGSFATGMPPAERWAALTTFVLLASATTLLGCAALYDGLGRVLRQDTRALLALVALLPALYCSYALSVRELNGDDLNTAIALIIVPTVSVWASRESRSPTLLDGVWLLYLALSLWFGLVPPLMLPQQGGLVGFFQLALVPLLLVLFAARGWPGLGYTWHLSWRELRDALLAAAAMLVVLLPIGVASGLVGLPIGAPSAGGLLGGAVAAYFYSALPAELLLRAGAQNGLARALVGLAGGRAAWLALVLATVLAALIGVSGGWWRALVGAVIGLGAGWVYKRSGKVTASAISHMLVVWLLGVMAR